MLRSSGRLLISFLKTVGNLIPLMSPDLGKKYTNLLVRIILKEFNSPLDEMKKVILKVLHESFEKNYLSKVFIKKQIFEQYFKSFWTAKLVINRGASFRLIETTTSFAGVIGVSKILKKLTFNLKEDNEVLRNVTMRTISSIVNKFGLEEVDEILEELLVDACLFAFR